MATIYPSPYTEVTEEMKPHGPEALLNSLRGQRIVLCDLNRIFDGWPKEINPNLDRLRHDVDVWLERCEPLFARKGTTADGCDWH